MRGNRLWQKMASHLTVTAVLFIFALGAAAQTTNGLSDAEIQGRKLAQQLCDARPAENFTNTGVLQIRDGKGKHAEIPVYCFALGWNTVYEAGVTNHIEILLVNHLINRQNGYSHWTNSFIQNPFHEPFWGKVFNNVGLSGSELMTPFAGSDFWICDLGLEFFHWPGQKIAKKENRRGRGCMVLESTNPEPSTNSYSRVLSWIDEESGGIVQAEAYDFKNKLLKEFAPKSFKKVNGQWELQDMEIYNDQTHSRTRISFDLKKQ